jgi:cell division protein FtsQ
VPYYYIKSSGYFETASNFIHSNFHELLSVKKVEITGNSLLPINKISDITKIIIDDKIYNYSAKNIRQQLLDNTEVKNASVKINCAGVIKIKIDEKKPLAILWNNNKPLLIDENGSEILKIDDTSKYSELILIFGKNIKKELRIFLDILQQYSLYKNVNVMHYIGNRRWDIYLNNDTILKLPEKGVDFALKKSEEILNNLKYKNKISILDLRLYPKKIFLKLKTQA